MKVDKNKKLMLDAGSKTGAYDIEAPDQWKWVLRHTKDPLEKGMAWVKSKTTAFNHESPFCVDEHGNPLFASHMGADCGWTEQTARNVLNTLESQGRIRLEKGKRGVNRIWYCADVPQAYEPANPAGEGRTKGDGCNSVQSYWGTYVVDFIEKLPEEKRAAAETKTESYLQWRREFMADGEAALRAIADRVEDTTLREIGVPKKRLPKRRPAECKWVQLELLAEPDFVQSVEPEASAESVQDPKSSSYEPKINGVRTKNGRLSLLCSTPTTAIEATAPKSIQENKPVSQSVSPLETDRPTDSFPAPPPENTPEAMAALLLDELGPQFPGQMPGKALCEQTVEALADTPWQEFSAKLRNRKWKASDGMGIVLPLAREVQARWKADAGKRQERKPAAAARSLCPKCSGAGLLNGKKWESLQDLAGVLPAECCDCEDGITTLGLLDGSAKAAGGNAT